MSEETNREIQQDIDSAAAVPRTTAEHGLSGPRSRVALGLMLAAPLLAIAIAYLAASNPTPDGRTERREATSEIAAPIGGARGRFPTGGLGMSLAEWEKEHGEADEIGVYPTSDVRFVDGTRQSYYQVYSERSKGRVFSISYEVRHVAGEDLEAVRAKVRSMASQLLPGDAELVDSRPASGVYPATELYESRYLRGRYPRPESAAVWGDAEPGSVTVEYREEPEPTDVYGEYGTRVVLTLWTGDRRDGS
jgi:hypothetical protein